MLRGWNRRRRISPRSVPAVLATFVLMGCDGEEVVNAGPTADVRVVNSTTVELVVGLETASSQLHMLMPPEYSTVLGTGISSAGGAVSFRVCAGPTGATRLECAAGAEVADRECHLLAAAIGNPSHVPTVTIYDQPLRIACTSGWEESEG